MRGTWQTDSHGRGRAATVAAAAIAAAVLLSALTAFLWVLAVTGLAIMALFIVAAILMRRWNRRESARFAARAETLRAEAAGREAPQITAAQAAAIHYHTHLHLAPGTDPAAAIRQALPDRSISFEVSGHPAATGWQERRHLS